MAQSRQRITDRDFTIAGDLMFSTVFRDPELCRGLIQMVLSVEIESVELVTPQARMQAAPLSRAGVVDVLARDAEGNLFDVEMQNSVRASLPRRARYYGSLMDATYFQRGEHFSELRDRAVVFICADDPFGQGLKRYTCRMTCRESGLDVPDGQLAVFLNVKGTGGESTPELDAFLAYMRDGSTMGDEYVREVDSVVRALRDDPVWRGELMFWSEKYRDDFADARDEGREEGRAEGRDEGLKEGNVEGRAELSEEYAQLSRALVDRGRADELPEALCSADARQRLFEEFGIGTGRGATDVTGEVRKA